MDGNINQTKESDSSKKTNLSANEIAQQRAGYNALKQQPGGAAAQNQSFDTNGNRMRIKWCSWGKSHSWIRCSSWKFPRALGSCCQNNGALLNTKTPHVGPSSNTAKNSPVEFKINCSEWLAPAATSTILAGGSQENRKHVNKS